MLPKRVFHVLALVFSCVLVAGCYYIIIADLTKKPVRRIIISNSSTTYYDSVVLRVNAFKIRIDSLASGKAVERKIDTDTVAAGHNVVYTFKVYRHGIPEFDEGKFMTDLGGLPARVKIIITESPALKYEIEW